MFSFLMGAAIGAAGYWAWQKYGQDITGSGGQQIMSRGKEFASTGQEMVSRGTEQVTSRVGGGSQQQGGSSGGQQQSSSDGSSKPDYIGTPGVASATGRDRTKDGDLPGNMAKP